MYAATMTAVDTLVALMACLVLFPITFSAGMEASSGPGLVFINMPLAFDGLPGGHAWSVLFFVLLFFAALSSAISLLEVAAAFLIDERGWSRPKAVGLAAGLVFALGIPSALSGDATTMFGATDWIGERNWFDSFDYLASNWMLPLGGLGIAGVDFPLAEFLPIALGRGERFCRRLEAGDKFVRPRRLARAQLGCWGEVHACS